MWPIPGLVLGLTSNRAVWMRATDTALTNRHRAATNTAALIPNTDMTTPTKTVPKVPPSWGSTAVRLIALGSILPPTAWYVSTARLGPSMQLTKPISTDMTRIQNFSALPVPTSNPNQTYSTANASWVKTSIVLGAIQSLMTPPQAPNTVGGNSCTGITRPTMATSWVSSSTNQSVAILANHPPMLANTRPAAYHWYSLDRSDSSVSLPHMRELTTGNGAVSGRNPSPRLVVTAANLDALLSLG